MHGQPKRPRHWAFELVDAWVAGKPTEVIILAIPANDVELARAHARIFCQNIQHHAKHTEDLEQLGELMAGWVEKYRARK